MTYAMNYIICMLSFFATAATVESGANVSPGVNIQLLHQVQE